jgi:hypothetical protein
LAGPREARDPEHAKRLKAERQHARWMAKSKEERKEIRAKWRAGKQEKSGEVVS